MDPKETSSNNATSSSASSLSTSQGRSSKWSKCLCHIRKDISGDLTPFSAKSWGTFHDAAELRRDEISDAMKSSWDDGPKGYYHRQCYQSYTNKSHLERLSSKRKRESVTSESEPNTSRMSRTQAQSTDKQKCVICQRDKYCKLPSGSYGKETLSLCLTEKACASLKTAAAYNNDERLLRLIRHNDDLIAQDVVYHRSCYRQYTKSTSTTMTTGGSLSNSSAYDEAFESLAAYIEKEVIEDLKVLQMSDLLTRYIALLAEENIIAPEYRSSKLKSRITKRFRNSVAFWHPSNRTQSEIIYSDIIQKGQIIEHGMETNAHDTDDETLEQTQKPNIPEVYHTAKYIRGLLMDIKHIMSWPPKKKELQLDKIDIPVIVYNMIAWIISSDTTFSESEKINVSDSTHCHIMSIIQDLIHCTSHGRTKTPKHFALPMTVKSLTGNAEVISLLNKFGHGLSYSQIEQAETSMAESELQRQVGGVLLPSECHIGIPAVFCWDNNDILEETLSGQGTTHCTNGIVIQRQPSTCAPPTQPNEPTGQVTRRSFKGYVIESLPFHSGRRQGPQPSIIDISKLAESPTEHLTAMHQDFSWLLSRLPMTNSIFHLDANAIQTVPGWTAFNMLLHKDNIPRHCQVAYCQTISASPTELPTVYTLLKRSIAMAEQMQQTDCIIVLDQAIYSKALEIIWQRTEEFQRIVLRMGAFHTTCTFLAVIGKRFADAGLSDILVESNVIGSGSVRGVIEGRHYNRAIRAHKLVYEALFRLQWDSFEKWCEEHEDVDIDDQNIVHALANIRDEKDQKSVESLLELQQFEKLFKTFQQFLDIDEGPMKTYWCSYMTMVSLLLRYLRATRTGNWQLHLACVRDMMPWMHAYDRTNYARYMPVYWHEMMSLPDSHPSAYDTLSAGEFAVQRNATQGFSMVAVDQTIEQTVNKNTKTKGGIIGFSLRHGAVQRWLVTAHARAGIVDCCRKMAGSTESNSGTHKEASTPRMNKDEQDVRQIKEIIGSWQNPFEPSDNLSSLASGKLADEATQSDLLGAKVKGCQAVEQFVSQRLMNGTTEFFSPLPRQNLKTFSTVKKRTNTSFKDAILQNDRDLFARLLVIAQTRKLDMRQVLSYELGPVPWSLASADGSLNKTTKSVLNSLLEQGTQQLAEFPTVTMCIFDAIAVLHTIKKPPETFEELASKILIQLLRDARGATRIDFVGDQYPVLSIKNVERHRRSSDGKVILKINSGLQKCPKQWTKFLSHGENKSSLLRFLKKEWSSQKFSNYLRDVTLFVTADDTCSKIWCVNNTLISTDEAELSSSQEEADTRMFLHAQHGSENGHNSIIICSSDVDVEVLACYYQSHINADLFLLAGNRAKSRIFKIRDLTSQLGQSLCQALPGLHALTGCDSVSAFSGRGKKKAFSLAKGSETHLQMLQQLGSSIPPDRSLFTKVEPFVCSMYGKEMDHVDDLRYYIFCKSKNIQTHHLPPTKCALDCQTKRANYQALTWKTALISHPPLPSPVGHGWSITENELVLKWTDQAAAPEAILELISCRCMGGCQNRRCSCLQNNLPCTEACRCGDTCSNIQVDDVEIDSNGDDDTDEDDIN